MANLYSYQPSFDISPNFCQSLDCKTLTITNILSDFLGTGIYWLIIGDITLDIYDSEDELVSTVDLTSQMKQSLTGTVDTYDDSLSVDGANTLFESEISSEDFVCVDDTYYFRVNSVTSDTSSAFTIMGDDLTAVTAYKFIDSVTLSGVDFGETSTDSIPDGVYKFIFKIEVSYIWDNDGEDETVTNDELTYETTQLYYCNSKCCVEKKIADFLDKANDCCIEIADIQDTMIAWMLLESLEFTANCQDTVKLENIFNKLKDYCKGVSPCNCT